jgi:hypothetical protein
MQIIFVSWNDFSVMDMQIPGNFLTTEKITPMSLAGVLLGNGQELLLLLLLQQLGNSPCTNLFPKMTRNGISFISPHSGRSGRKGRVSGLSDTTRRYRHPRRRRTG